MMLLTFIAAAHPSLTHLLFALCFIERDESVFPFDCPAWPTLLPQWYIHQTAPAAPLMKWSMWPDVGTKDGTVPDSKFLTLGIQMRISHRVSHSGLAVRASFKFKISAAGGHTVAVSLRKASYLTDLCRQRLILDLSCFTFSLVIIQNTYLKLKRAWPFSCLDQSKYKQLIDPFWLLIEKLNPFCTKLNLWDLPFYCYFQYKIANMVILWWTDGLHQQFSTD